MNRAKLSIASGIASFFFLVFTLTAHGDDTTLWQIGAADDSAAEFGDYRDGAAVEIAAGAKSPDKVSAISKGLHGSVNPQMEIRFQLAEVPKHGAMFRFKLLQAVKTGPQMSVFANDLLAGLIQLWGTAESDCPYPWRKTYRLYIPSEMLHKGANAITLRSEHPMWSDASVDKRLWWEWDYLALDALQQPAREPIHGALAYLGTTMKHSANDFFVNDDTLRLAPVALRWLGVAYSGNTVRADFWHDVAAMQPRRVEYLKLLRDLNMTVIADNVSSGHFRLTADGAVPDEIKQSLKRFFADCGEYFQWYEIANEPCMFGGGYRETLAVAELVNQLKPAHVKTTAPGYAYGGGRGTPINWDADPLLRRKVELLCQAINGHSYGFSFADNRGGSFLENLRACEGVADGWPMEYVNTETGANNWHSEENAGPRFASSQSHAQSFDRILRAHLAVCDRTMQHAAIFDDFGFFSAPADWKKLEQLKAFPGVEGEDTRLKTFRRLALAYATHGTPLPYVVRNAETVRGKLVYFRAVDTAAIPAQPGSGATSNRILLNFVNFEPSKQTLAVSVTMPAVGAYAGDRIETAETWAASRRDVSLTASPKIELKVELGPGEAVQYVLAPPKPAVPYAPERLQAAPGDGKVTLSWAASAGATAYCVYQVSAAGDKKIVVDDIAATEYIDSSRANGTACRYCVVAKNKAGASSPSEIATATPGQAPPPAWVRTASGDGRVRVWFAESEGARSYSLVRAERAAGPFAPLAKLDKAASYVDTKCTSGKTYYYAVSAVGATGEGPSSPAVKATPQTPPPAPAEVRAVAGDGRIVLQWKPSADAMGYRVERADKADGPFTTIAADLVACEFFDNATENGKTLFYRVCAQRDEALGKATAAMQATAGGEALPKPWKSADVGVKGRPGRASWHAAAKTFTVEGSGHDIWAEADGLHFACQTLAAKGSLTARVAAFEETHPWAKFGVMVRASTDAGSPMAVMAITPTNGVSFTSRKAQDGKCEQTGGPAQRWLRIVRDDNTVCGFASADGKAWTEIGKAEIELKGDALIGLCVCSHDGNRLNKVIFEEVE